MAVTALTGWVHTVVDLLRETAERHPEVEAYVEPASGPSTTREVMTFGDWDRRADGVAGLLASEGVVRGDVVALALPSGIDYAVVYAAAMRLGAVTSGINPRTGPAERHSMFERTRPRVTVADDPGADPRAVPADNPGAVPADNPGAVPAGAPAGPVLGRAAIRAAFSAEPPRQRARIREDDPVAVVWTSGTTGRPKGAVFDHRNLEAVARGTDVLSHPGARRLSPLPFAHVGYMTRPWDEISKLVTTVLTPTPWRAADALAVLATERITVAQGVPAQWRLVLDLPEFDEADLSAIRVVGTGAAPVPSELVSELRRRLGAPVVVRYTSTESSLGTGTRPDDPDEVVATTVGRPVPGVELRILGSDGEPAPIGEVGHVQLRSEAVMRGYFGRDEPSMIDREATAEVVDGEGWLRTGDSGRLGADGNLRLVGRDHELYLRGGYKVYPAEVEAVLEQHPGVRQAVVVGAPDPVLGEVGVAFVVPEAGGDPPDLEALRSHCRAFLSDYKAPDALVTLEELPLTPMMKVDRRPLGRWAAEAAERRDVGPRRRQHAEIPRQREEMR